MGENMRVNDRDRMPVRKYSFPAGVCGAEIRINIPAIATKEDVEQMAAAMAMVAEKWKTLE